MKDLRSLPPTVIAVCALLVAASGTAGALAGKNSIDNDDLQKNVVKSKNVTKGSLKGSDIKNDGLTGKQVKESSLSTVPKAASVDTVKFYEATLVEGQTKVLLAEGTFSLVAQCVADVTDTRTDVLVATTQPGTAFAGDDDNGVITPLTIADDRDIESNSDAPGDTASASDGYDDQFWIRSAAGKKVFGTVASVTNADVNSCVVFGTYTTS